MREIKFLPGAEQDYRESFQWYRSRSAQAAAGFEVAVEIALDKIRQGPETYALCDEQHRFYILRRYPFSIVYRLTIDEILIVAVAHSSRDSSFWQNRQ